MNAVNFIQYGTETLALCAALPDWSDPMTLEIELPGDVTDSLLKTESRRRFSSSQRYDLTHRFATDNAGDSHDLRAWLNRLKIETVAVPLWMDEVVLQAACTPAATTLQIEADLPVRSGAEWLILSDDGQVYEIVVVQSLVPGTMTLNSPGTALAWPAGTTLYPLMFGRLTERPQLTSVSDETFSTSLRFHENSAFGRKLNPRAVPLKTVGIHVPGWELYRLWNLEPHFSEPLDWTEADILYQRIGHGREDDAYQYQNWNRRGSELEFVCASRDEMAQVEYFFNDRGGTTKSFFMPTWRGDLRLAADIATGSSTFEIEPSRYEIASYDEQPWNAFICLIDDTGVHPQRVIEVDQTTIRLQVELTKSYTAATTQVCFLQLVRFAEPTLKWEYTSDGLARVKLKVIEVPDEYTTPAISLSPPAYLFQFTEKTPTPNNWRFTNYESAISYGGKTFSPAPFSFDRYKAARDLSDELSLKSWGGDFTGNPLNQFLPFTLNATMSLTITRVNADNPDDGAARVLFYGDVMGLDTTGTDWSASVKFFGRRLDQKFPRFLYQTQDNYTQFSPPTQLSAAAFQANGLLTNLAYNGSPFTIRLSSSTFVSDYFSNGRLETGTGANFERRSILKSMNVGFGQELTIDRPLLHAAVGQGITLWAGYDQSRDQCQAKFNNNLNFGGHPFMPDSNVITNSAEIKTPTGGKK